MSCTPRCRPACSAYRALRHRSPTVREAATERGVHYVVLHAVRSIGGAAAAQGDARRIGGRQRGQDGALGVRGADCIRRCRHPTIRSADGVPKVRAWATEVPGNTSATEQGARPACRVIPGCKHKQSPPVPRLAAALACKRRRAGTEDRLTGQYTPRCQRSSGRERNEDSQTHHSCSADS